MVIPEGCYHPHRQCRRFHQIDYGWDQKVHRIAIRVLDCSAQKLAYGLAATPSCRSQVHYGSPHGAENAAARRSMT